MELLREPRITDIMHAPSRVPSDPSGATTWMSRRRSR